MKGMGRRAVVIGLLLGLVSSPVRSAGQESEHPITVALVLDTSGSIDAHELARTRELAAAVLTSLPAGSEFAVFSFDDQSRLLLPRTAEIDAVRRAVDGIETYGRYTALHDALYDASRYLRDVPSSRRVILLVTDGKDENSALKLEDGLAVARETGIPVFCVGVGRVAERVLRRIAKLTGGAYVPSAEATGALLASQIAAVPPTTPAARASAAVSVASAPPPAAPAPTTPPTPPPRAPTGARMALWSAAGLLAVIGAVTALLVLRRREAGPAGVAAAKDGVGRPEPGPRAEPGFSSTVLSRLDAGDERVDKTVVIRESPVLEVTKGPGIGLVFELSWRSATSLGRARANDIVLDDVAISSQHCRIRPEGGSFVLHDLESTNGTLVNNHRVSRHVLAPGDVIKMGDTCLEFRMDRERP
jgi:hypothetical protein